MSTEELKQRVAVLEAEHEGSAYFAQAMLALSDQMHSDMKTMEQKIAGGRWAQFGIIIGLFSIAAALTSVAIAVAFQLA